MAIYHHENFIRIHAITRVWRYMDLSKFSSLLQSKGLFFCRADKFSDPFEGSLPKKEAEFRLIQDRAIADHFKREFDKEQALRNIRDLQIHHQKLKRGTVMNCWHINHSESDAMWRLYLKDNEGVAIQSNARRLTYAFQKTTEVVSFSKVRYLDYDNSIWHHPVDYPSRSYNLYIPLIHKRIEFEHEREFRIFSEIPEAVNDEDYWERQPNHIGKFISIDLNCLVEKIFLPPTIDLKAASYIEELIEHHGFDFTVIKSNLSKEPLY